MKALNLIRKKFRDNWKIKNKKHIMIKLKCINKIKNA